MSAWEIDCNYWYGKVLRGKFNHWCPEWDDLPIDETRPEFECCSCFKDAREDEIPSL